MQKLFSQNIRDLLKVELHRHLDCSVRWSTLVELAPQVGIQLAPTSQGQKDQFLITKPMKDLGSVLGKFLNAQKVLASEEILTRIAFEACEDAYNDGIRLLELRYAPTFIADGHASLDFEKIHRSLTKGVDMAKKKFAMAVGMICIVQRVKPYNIAEKVVDFAIDHKDSFIALDLADNEEGFDPKAFAPLFQKAKKAGLHITVHSGETPNDLAASWVKDSVEILGAERIGHGIQIVRDLNILNFVRDHKIPLEVCPISNYLTQSFETYEAHPIRNLVNSGVLVTINSDDPGVFATTLSDDYEVLHRVHNFSEEDFRRCNQIAFNASFISDQEKARFKQDFFNHG
ncbi:adenosine deaminase [Bdellovibrio svalbardensis]|uniref:adenosine deaminase n=1 Tax=Bdellovibrio svalbardensis TaxID=2972972 RepID=A0ABT6DEN0_9BACT|nr:adenosine deaminase [Bdellovibrio svalbardensis]MDG0815287.1 adenosine deaminase [Bdellovibrio svalbardensis]